MRQYFSDPSYYANDVQTRGMCSGGASNFLCEAFSPSSATVKVLGTAKLEISISAFRAQRPVPLVSKVQLREKKLDKSKACKKAFWRSNAAVH